MSGIEQRGFGQVGNRTASSVGGEHGIAECDQGTIERVDGWRAEQGDLPSRAEAIRRLVDAALATRNSRPPLVIDDGQKLIVFMLCELYKGLKTRTELDPTFIENALFGGHYWALRWRYPGVFESYPDDEQNVRRGCRKRL